MTDIEQPVALLSLLYSSQAATPVDDNSLDVLLRHSRNNNARDGITGMLLYRDGRFIQVLEGPESVVRGLVERIGADPRHRAVRVLLEEHISERRFAEWTMGYQPVRVPRREKPTAFRDSFDDLDADDDTTTMRAIRELTLWFRVRSAAAA